MINGRISDLRLPQIPISLQDSNGIWQTLEAVVDTGFTGELALPVRYIERFGLELNDEIPVTPATGQTILVPAGNVRLVWQGRRMLAHAVQSGSHPLIGCDSSGTITLPLTLLPTAPLPLRRWAADAEWRQAK